MKFRDLKPSQNGAAAVELAVILPILLTIIFGVIEFGHVLMVYHNLNSAAREGARVAVLPGADNAQVTARITQELASMGLTADAIVFTPGNVSTAAVNDPVTVRVTINYTSIGWVTGFFPGFDSAQFHGIVVMRKEGFS